MKSVITTPEQILEVWEKKFQVLSKSHRKEFLSHSITEKLCKYQLFQIEAALDLSKAKYLSEILFHVKYFAKKSREDIRDTYEFRNREADYLAEIAEWKKSIGNVEFAPMRQKIAPNPNVAKYDRYICANRITHGRSDECRCEVAA
jgi:hypothetical protein